MDITATLVLNMGNHIFNTSSNFFSGSKQLIDLRGD